MKKYLIVLFTFFSFSLFSQGLASVDSVENDSSENEGEKLIFNFFYSPSISSNLELGKDEKPKMNNFFGIDLMYEGRKTYHYVGFDISQKAISVTNGYSFSENFGVYNFGSFSFKKEITEIGKFQKLKTVSLGFEYFLKTKYSEIIIFYEFGTEFFEFKKIGENNLFSLGVIFEVPIKQLKI